MSGVDPADYDRLKPLYEVRNRLRELFGVEDGAKIAQLVNSLVAEAPMSSAAERPRRLRLALALLRAQRQP
ncbi:MAG: hypothetical protein WKF76_00645 [Nocardioidaceae bacterium]